MKWWILALCVLLGCTKPEPKTNRLKISFNTQPTTTDPRKAGDFVSSTLVCMIYEGLTRCSAGKEVEPALAKRVDVSLDKTTYTFHLREAYWTDGTPIRAVDFEKSWKEIISTPSSCTFLFYPIKNAERCAKGELSIDEVGISSLNDRTFQVQLERPTPYFYSLTAFPSFLPVPSHIENDPTVSSGPFQIEKMVHNSEIILKKNTRFWNAAETGLDEIHVSIVQDEMTALQMFEQGELDFLGGAISPLPPDALPKLKERLSFIPCPATTLCTFNTETFPFNNLNLRKAFSLAIDREEVAQEGQIPASSILPPVFTNQKFLLSDPEQARVHLANALDELQIDPIELESLTLYFKPSQSDKRLAQTLQKQWKEVLGITVQLELLDYKSHAQKLQTRDYQISLAVWIAQFDDPISILERFKDQKNLKNYPGWENSHYAHLLNEFRFNEAEALFAEEVPLTSIYHWSSPTIAAKEIESIPTSPCGGILFERFKLAKNK